MKLFSLALLVLTAQEALIVALPSSGFADDAAPTLQSRTSGTPSMDAKLRSGVVTRRSHCRSIGRNAYRPTDSSQELAHTLKRRA